MGVLFWLKCFFTECIVCFLIYLGAWVLFIMIFVLYEIEEYLTKKWSLQKMKERERKRCRK